MKRFLKIAGFLVGALLVIALALTMFVQLTWDSRNSRPVPALAARRDSASIARGQYIYLNTWQCWGCHSNGGATAPPAGGRTFDLSRTGPGFGVFYSRNITSDSATGIGAWSDGEIVQAIREGVNRDRRVLFPIMPVDWLHKISDEDALAVVAYLRSLPPVRNAVPQAAPSFVAKALFAFGVVSAMPPIDGGVQAPPTADSVAYGRYAATALAGCADCHTPRNLQNGKFYLDSLFAGGTIALGEPEGEPLVAYAANLRAILAQGDGQWTEEQFATAVTSGMRPDGTVIAPHMPYPMYKFLKGNDLHAIYTYLTSLTRIARTSPQPRYPEWVSAARGLKRGEYLFQARCQPCHGSRGTGTPATAVRLAEVAGSLSGSDLHDFISAGQLNLKMPSFGKTLNSDELNDIIAYIQSWGQGN
ncbi:MAG TPA: c-type cytochrome [Bacteroidota bacterium]|nr:c-type cytochrome [Bacteroidota bacterium]